jgi:regulator of protease activity HflC (stomatin/prohibitin superfamily)
VESKFVEECASRTLNEILTQKEEIMKSVRDDVTSYFADRGITITVLGMKDGLDYDDATIQKSINDKFSSEMKLTTQKNENERIISEAQAKAEANRILSESLTDKILQKQYYEKWDGKLPTVMSDSNGIIIEP